ncbi:hypothetical protein [Corynebacterium sp. A21]|uniref:hypothetical protein n=1 Tax=Corynebacterium sp. A21 TaxID=3457318 RepID=UPI003FD5B6AA
MDPSLRLASLTAFYFGAHVAADPASPETIRTVSTRAYRDLSRTLHGIGTHPDKATLLEDTHTSLQQFTADLDTVDSQDTFDALHDKWCRDRIHFFDEYPHPDRKEFALTYGQAQKWLNMTMKYLSVLDHPAVTRVYPYLHVPIDSIIFKEAAHPTADISVPRPPGGVAWSRLDRDHYRNYQRRLQDSITDRSDGTLTPLDWEAQAWIARSSEHD